MPAHSAVRIDDNLSPCQPGVAHGPANHKSPRRINVVLGIFIQQLSRNRRLNHMLKNIGAKLVIRYCFGVLS